MDLLIGLQIFHVVFLFAHDWVPLGALNDVEAQRLTDSFGKRFRITALTGLPYALLLAATWRNAGVEPLPGLLLVWLWIGYGLLFAGEVTAWWIPYTVRPDAVRAARYEQLFGRTHAFLPQRNGIRPNTLHVVLHLATLMVLICLAWQTTLRFPA
jgi:hypothetical protein